MSFSFTEWRQIFWRDAGGQKEGGRKMTLWHVICHVMSHIRESLSVAVLAWMGEGATPGPEPRRTDESKKFFLTEVCLSIYLWVWGGRQGPTFPPIFTSNSWIKGKRQQPECLNDIFKVCPSLVMSRCGISRVSVPLVLTACGSGIGIYVVSYWVLSYSYKYSNTPTPTYQYQHPYHYN